VTSVVNVGLEELVILGCANLPTWRGLLRAKIRRYGGLSRFDRSSGERYAVGLDGFDI
jgi:hypothetical protein